MRVSNRRLAAAFFCGVAAMGFIRMVAAGVGGVPPNPVDVIGFATGVLLALATGLAVRKQPHVE